ncbi:hypothetical protein BJX64DRAFT_257324 [Aspergillus heterothallicus]
MRSTATLLTIWLWLSAIVVVALPAGLEADPFDDSVEPPTNLPSFPITDLELWEPPSSNMTLADNGEFICNPPGYILAEKEKFEEGINVIKKWKGEVLVQPWSCVRVYCTGDAAILGCNRRETAPMRLSYKHITQSAKDVLKTCPARTEGGPHYLAGIYNGPNLWRTILKLDHHRC